MPHINKEQAARFELKGASFIGFAAPSRGARDTSVWRLRLEPHAPSQKHALDREEIFVALAGCAEFELGQERFAVRPGEAFIVPAQTFFSVTACGDQAFEAIVVLPVGALARFERGDAFIPPWAQ